MSKKKYSVAKVVTHTQNSIGKCERHNEKKNETYANMNVYTSCSAMNVHFQSSGELTYNEQQNKLIDEKKVCMRGLKADAKVFDEMIFYVNTDYFEQHGVFLCLNQLLFILTVFCSALVNIEFVFALR